MIYESRVTFSVYMSKLLNMNLWLDWSCMLALYSYMFPMRKRSVALNSLSDVMYMEDF